VVFEMRRQVGAMVLFKSDTEMLPNARRQDAFQKLLDGLIHHARARTEVHLQKLCGGEDVPQFATH